MPDKVRRLVALALFVASLMGAAIDNQFTCVANLAKPLIRPTFRDTKFCKSFSEREKTRVDASLRRLRKDTLLDLPLGIASAVSAVGNGNCNG